jgi:hypothetical protein
MPDTDLSPPRPLLEVIIRESTVNLIANGVHALLRHPDQLHLLAGRRRPGHQRARGVPAVRLVGPAGPADHPHPQQVGDQVIPANSFVLGLVGSANRDEDFFGPGGGELRVDRPNAKKHFSFGDRATTASARPSPGCRPRSRWAGWSAAASVPTVRMTRLPSTATSSTARYPSRSPTRSTTAGSRRVTWCCSRARACLDPGLNLGRSGQTGLSALTCGRSASTAGTVRYGLSGSRSAAG